MAIPYLTSATLPYGSRVLTINAVAYIANNYKVDQGGALIERQNELGAPNGAVLILEASTGSAQLQLATTTTAIPAIGDEFTADTVTYFLTQVGASEEARGFKTVDISFRKKV